MLHLVLVLLRLEREDEARGGIGRRPAGDAGQQLFDTFCRDLDANLREMGVGDLAVPKRMQRFGEAFYGRLSDYRAAFACVDDRELENALARNIFGVAGSDDRAVRLARYARAAAAQLAAEAVDALFAGNTIFPRPEIFVNA